jgi:hypothetical protein
MSEAKPDLGRADGSCGYCGEWAVQGVVVAEIYGDSGPGHRVVRHAEHVGLPVPVPADRPRTYPR